MDKGWGFVRILYHTCCRCVKRLNFFNILVHFIAPLQRGNEGFVGQQRSIFRPDSLPPGGNFPKKREEIR